MNYEGLKKNIKTGDILLVSGYRWLSNRIKDFTGSEYNHIGMFIWVYDELFVAEMDRINQGLLNIKAEIKLTNFNDYLEGNYSLLIRKPKEYIDGSDIGALILKDLGVKKFKYSYFDLLIAQPIFQITGKWIGKKKIDNTLICSQYVAWRYNDYKGWYDKWYKKAPSDFVNDNHFKDYISIKNSYIKYYN